MFFFIGDDGRLTYLPDFRVVVGRQSPIRIRDLAGQVHTLPGNREPDRFSFSPPATVLPLSHHFRVVDQGAIVYDCVPEQLAIAGAATCSGLVASSGPPDQLQAARQLVQQAVEAVRAEPGAAADTGRT